MLKRIAILGEDEQAQKALAKGVKRADVHLVAITKVLMETATRRNSKGTTYPTSRVRSKLLMSTVP